MLILAADHKRLPIIIDVESPGGSLKEAFAIIRTMKGVSCPVATYCRGTIGGPSILIAAHGAHHIAQITQFQEKDYADEGKTWDVMRQHVYTIADALTTALASQWVSAPMSTMTSNRDVSWRRLRGQYPRANIGI